MKKIPAIALSLTLPLALLSPALGQTPATPTAEGKIETKIPSISFYHYDQ